MSTSESSFSWGADTFARGSRLRKRRTSRDQSLLGARMAALMIDGLVLIAPLLAIDFALAQAFPHHGFGISTRQASSGAGYTLGLPGLLIVSAVSLAYFFLCEALYGRTLGKRAMGLHVRSAAGGSASLNAVSARTVLRLIDGLAFYLVGAMVAILSGSRRRRIGDLLGGTVVVREEDIAGDPPRSAPFRAFAYPTIWLVAVLLAVFALGLGKAAGVDEEAVALTHSYVDAREQGNAALACSMLSREQQRELVALQSHSYSRARASRCPVYILKTNSHSHLLNPSLPTMLTAPVRPTYSSLGAVLVRSTAYPSMVLVAVLEGSQLKLDMRGFQKVGFMKGCTSTGRLTEATCGCAFTLLRSQGLVPEAQLTSREVRALRMDEVRCRAPR